MKRDLTQLHLGVESALFETVLQSIITGDYRSVQKYGSMDRIKEEDT